MTWQCISQVNANGFKKCFTSNAIYEPHGDTLWIKNEEGGNGCCKCEENKYCACVDGH